MLVFLSRALLASKWVAAELQAGLVEDIEERSIKILPVMLDVCEPPLGEVVVHPLTTCLDT